MAYLFSPLVGGHHRHYCDIYSRAFLEVFASVVLFCPIENFPSRRSSRLVCRPLPHSRLSRSFRLGTTYVQSLVYWFQLLTGPRRMARLEPGPLLILFGDALRSQWIGRRLASFFLSPDTYSLIWNLYAGRGLEEKTWAWLRSERIKGIGVLDETRMDSLPHELKRKSFWFPEVTA